MHGWEGAVDPGVAGASDHTCALSGSGAVECWGLTTNTALDFGQTSGAPTSDGYVAVSVGRFHSCAVDAASAVTCWGIADGSERDAGQVSDAP